jgi:hypothetical protein
VSRAVGGAVHDDEAAVLEDTVDNGVCHVVIVQGVAPLGEGRLVGGEDHGPATQVPVVDDVEQDVGGVGAVGQVADLVDDQQVGAGVGGQGLAQLGLAARPGQVVDQLSGGGEACCEAVLDGAVADGDGQVGLATAGLAEEDQVAPLGDQLRSQVGPQQGEAQAGLEGEVEVLDGLQVGEAGLADLALHTCVASVGDLLGEQDGEQLAGAPALGLGAVAQVAPVAAGVGQVQTLEQRLQVEGLGIEGQVAHALASGCGKKIRCWPSPKHRST